MNNMLFAMVIAPAAPIRKKAKHASEMTNQLLFGETVEVFKEKEGGWLKIRSLHDDYEGWIRGNLLLEIKEKEAKLFNEYVTADIVNAIRMDEAIFHVPMGSSLPAFTAGHGMINDRMYSFSGQHNNRRETQPNPGLLNKLVQPWLNAPYLWGGRTHFGVDCSGFVQVIFKMIGIDMPRDAWQQAQKGKTVKKLKEAICGDLVFFDDKEEIVHVGILLDNERVIHASGKVRIDGIDKKGIVHSETSKYTHKLKIIKRNWQ